MDLNIRENLKQILTHTKILVVEETSTAQKITETLLNQLGCHFDFASTGNEAILTDFKNYHLILIDIFLPDINGFDVAQSIRRLEISKKYPTQIPLIAYTDCSEVIKEACLMAGFNDFLFKPASVDDFRRLIQRLLLNNKNT